ncbi:MAG: thioesterase domain-containing protein, partial [Waterburya sp.]
VRYYILDANLMPLPVGVPGELYIGGDCLARGYLNRPELTAERFIPDPFIKQVEQTEQFEARMYKTGDLACYFADGTVNCLGRLDRQVKIRGFRIEPGEIEAAIALHPHIQQTVVIVREDNPGDQRLVAYIITRPEQTVTTEEIRHFLKPQLPGHMIPGALVILQTFPLTLNGKIDNRALPAPMQVRKAETSATFVAPRDHRELQLTKIWEKVLGVKSISIHDNFFDLGGQSLLAARLFAEVNEIFQRKLTLSTIFQAPTIEQLAKVLSPTEYLSNSSYLVPIQPFGSKVPFFCIHGAQGEVLFLKSLANHLGSDQPFYAIRSPGQNGEIAPLTCIKEMAKLYIEEIKTIQPQGPYLLGGYSFGGLVAFEMAQQLQKQAEEVSLLALLDCYAPGSRRSLTLANISLKHFRNFLAIGPDYVLKKLKTLRTKYLYRLFKGETMRNNYFHHLTSTKYFYNLINEFPNYTVQDLELWENLYKANLQASLNYIPSVYAGKITIFRVVIDPTEDFYRPVANCGWSKLSNQEIELHDCTGDHYSFIEEPHVQGLARQLQTCLISANER